MVVLLRSKSAGAVMTGIIKSTKYEDCEFKVEHGIPLAKENNRGKPEKYPWSKMKVGDSFFVPASDLMDRKKAQNSVSSCGRKARCLGRFVTRITESPLGVRVWRMS
jgi:hypothetical protein